MISHNCFWRRCFEAVGVLRWGFQARRLAAMNHFNKSPHKGIIWLSNKLSIRVIFLTGLASFCHEGVCGGDTTASFRCLSQTKCKIPTELLTLLPPLLLHCYPVVLSFSQLLAGSSKPAAPLPLLTNVTHSLSVSCCSGVYVCNCENSNCVLLTIFFPAVIWIN